MNRRFILPNISFGAPKPSSPPTILVTKKALRIDAIKDDDSPIKEYQVSGIRLTGDIVISIESSSRSFKICGTKDGEYCESLTLTHSNGTVGKTTIYVKLASTNTVGTSNAKIIHRSNDAANVTLSLTGHVGEIADEDPSIELSPTSYTFEEELGGTIVPQRYTVVGQNLTEDIAVVVDGTNNIQISKQENSAYSNNLTLRHDDGSVNQAIYVKVSNTQLLDDTATITHSSADCVPQTFTATWAPRYILITGDLDTFETNYGTPSTAQTYHLRGIRLRNKIKITAPTGFELSDDDVSYSSSILVDKEFDGDIYVRLTGAESGPFSGDIVHNSTGVSNQNKEVMGAVTDAVTEDYIGYYDTYKDIIAVRDNYWLKIVSGEYYLSADYGSSWTKSLDEPLTDVQEAYNNGEAGSYPDAMNFCAILDDGKLFVAYHKECYYTDADWTGWSKSSITAGTYPLAQKNNFAQGKACHVPAILTEGETAIEMLVWGVYHNSSKTVWYTADNGATVKPAYEFGVGDNITPRHAHIVDFNPFDDTFWLLTGDFAEGIGGATEEQRWFIKGEYNVSEGAWTWTPIISGAEYKASKIVFSQEGEVVYAYWSDDNWGINPVSGGIRKCLYSKIATQGSSELILHTSGDCVGLYLWSKTGEIIATRTSWPRRGNPPVVNEDPRYIYYSPNLGVNWYKIKGWMPEGFPYVEEDPSLYYGGHLTDTGVALASAVAPVGVAPDDFNRTPMISLSHVIRTAEAGDIMIGPEWESSPAGKLAYAFTYGVATPGTPTVDLAAGTYEKGQLATITLAETPLPKEATIIYTIDGTTPSISNGTVSTTGVVRITSSCTFKVIAYRAGVASDVVTRQYTITKEDEYDYVNDETFAYVQAMASEPAAGVKEALDGRITAIKASSGLWEKFDQLLFFDIHNSSDALINVVDPTQAATNSNCTHSVNNGFTGSADIADDKYINSNMTLGGAAHASQNSLSVFVWANTDNTDNGAYFGVSDLVTASPSEVRKITYLSKYSQANVVRATLNSDLGGYVESAVVTDFSGLFVATRSALNKVSIYRNVATPIGTDVDLSTGTITTNELYYGGTNKYGTGLGSSMSREMRIAGFGAALTGEEVAVLYGAINGNPMPGE